MSQENVELVERTYALIEDLRGPRPEDFDRPLRELVHDAFELHLPEVYPEGEQVFRGPEGLKSWIAMFKEVWGEWRFELERVLPAGDRVGALIRVLARGGSSASVFPGRRRTCGRSRTVGWLPARFTWIARRGSRP
jgi:ketosteroid isomerase-like protein